MESFNMPSRKNKRIAAKKKISELNQRPENCLAIYYSYADDGQTRRITSIALRNLSTKKTETFSIYKTTEQRKLDSSEINSNCDFLEREMLKEFYNYAKKVRHCTLIHWEMQDDMYGFPALEHRYKVLGGKAVEIIPEDRKFDLARAMIDIFAERYVNTPYFENLVKLNEIHTKDFLSRKNASETFKNKDFKKLHQSTLRGVYILTDVFEKISDTSIKTNAKWKNIHGVSFDSIVTYIKSHPIMSAVSICSTLIGVVVKLEKIF